MTVISISISESTEQIIAGFPKSVSLSTNIPSTIFYTLDGTDPDTMSSVYTGAITFPTDVLSLVLKVYATNGSDNSPIITQSYNTNILHNTRLPHATSGDVGIPQQSRYPYGSNSPRVQFDYLNSANAGTTVDNPNLPVVNYGYDGSGNPIGSNQPIDDYLNVYKNESKDKKWKAVPGVLPGRVTVIGRRNPSAYSVEESDRSSATFDARAMVIFQNTATEDPSRPPQINPQYFTMTHLETKDSELRATGLGAPTITGSFVKSHYNPRTQEITYYYRDSATNRWIISSTPYNPALNKAGNLSSMVFGKGDSGVGRVYQAYFGKYRTLT